MGGYFRWKSGVETSIMRRGVWWCETSNTWNSVLSIEDQDPWTGVTFFGIPESLVVSPSISFYERLSTDVTSSCPIRDSPYCIILFREALAEFNNSLKSTHCSNSRGMFSASIPTCNDHNGAGDSLLFQIQKPWDKPWSTTYCFFFC